MNSPKRVEMTAIWNYRFSRLFLGLRYFYPHQTVDRDVAIRTISQLEIGLVVLTVKVEFRSQAGFQPQ